MEAIFCTRLSVRRWGYLRPAYVRRHNVPVPAGSGRYSNKNQLGTSPTSWSNRSLSTRFSYWYIRCVALFYTNATAQNSCESTPDGWDIIQKSNLMVKRVKFCNCRGPKSNNLLIRRVKWIFTFISGSDRILNGLGSLELNPIWVSHSNSDGCYSPAHGLVAAAGLASPIPHQRLLRIIARRLDSSLSIIPGRHAKERGRWWWWC